MLHKLADAIGEKMLSERHRRMLEVESRIHPDVIADRGYWTAESVEDLEGVPGIKRNQFHAPALVIPVYGVDGEYRYSRVRPDEAPPGTGKYIQPAGTANVLDAPRSVRGKVLDAGEPLAYTEGEKKADYLASRGVAVVGLFGCWNWSNKTNEGTPLEMQILLADFDAIPHRDRPVSILFDCDIRINKNLQLAAYRFAQKLRERGAVLW
jgi:hypothetical protein